VEIAGRNREDSAYEKITLTEVRQEILNQFPLLNSDDLIPVPCNPDALAMGYILKLEGEIIPLTRYINPADLLNNETRNTIVYEQDTGLQMQLLDIFSTGISVDKVQPKVNQLLCCLPEVSAPDLDYDNLFRIIIMNFMDAHDFDVRAVKKSCVHIVNKDLKLIPFETMNLFEATQLCPQFRNRPLMAPEAAFSISASSKTMNGSLPPSSSTHFLSLDVARWATLAPISILPVKVTPSMLESINISAIFEFPITVLNNPSGAPLFSIDFSISMPHCIVALAGFKTIAFPAINEGAANRNACQ